MTLTFATSRLAAMLVIAAWASPGSAATFDPIGFFAGHTEGRGTLRVMLSRRRPVSVHGRGRVERDGSLVLDQTVAGGGADAPSERRWTFTPAGVGRYTGTLTDATGPVAGMVDGPRLHLHFHVKHGIVADQWLDLAADGHSAHNRMTFRKFGMVVARLDETITRD